MSAGENPPAGQPPADEPPPSSDEEEEGEGESEPEEGTERAGRPLGQVPAFEIDPGYPYECKGSITQVNTATIYHVGPPLSEAGIMLIGDMYGWSGGRVRIIADYLASALNAHVSVPRLFDKPPLAGGTDGDGLPPDFDSKARAPEVRKWLLRYVWETFKPKVLATAIHLRNCGAKRIAGVGFCVGAWIVCRATKIIGEYACSVLMYPSVHIMQELSGAYNEDLGRQILRPALFMRAGDDPDMYDEGGEVFRFNKETYGKDSESLPFLQAEHGWVTRGDVSNPRIKADTQLAMLLAAKFLRKFLWPHPRGADAGTLRLRCMEGDEKEVKRLLDTGVPAGGRDALDELNLTPLHYVARHGHFGPVKLLVEFEADVNEAGGSGLETPLHVAAGLNHSKVVRMLVTLKADVQARDKAGQTPLHHAAKAGALPCVKTLLERRADMWARDTSEQSPLHFAAWMGRTDTVTLLLKARMDVEPFDLRVFTPAERATQQGYIPIAQQLERERLRREDEEFHANNPVADPGSSGSQKGS